MRVRRVAALPAAACALLLGFVWACGPPPFRVSVTFPGEVVIEPGAAVVYEGMKVGEVERIALRQDDPERPALVELRLAITNREIRLRTADRFHLSSLRGVAVVEVEPALRDSPPLADGSTVAGVPPMITRIEAEIERAIEGIGKAALDAVEEALGALGQPAPEAEVGPGDPGGGAAPGTPPPEATSPETSLDSAALPELENP